MTTYGYGKWKCFETLDDANVFPCTLCLTPKTPWQNRVFPHTQRIARRNARIEPGTMMWVSGTFYEEGDFEEAQGFDIFPNIMMLMMYLGFGIDAKANVMVPKFLVNGRVHIGYSLEYVPYVATSNKLSAKQKKKILQKKCGRRKHSQGR